MYRIDYTVTGSSIQSARVDSRLRPSDRYRLNAMAPKAAPKAAAMPKAAARPRVRIGKVREPGWLRKLRADTNAMPHRVPKELNDRQIREACTWFLSKTDIPWAGRMLSRIALSRHPVCAQHIANRMRHVYRLAPRAYPHWSIFDLVQVKILISVVGS